MYRQLAREHLGRLWALIATARQQSLSEADRQEVYRLCSLLGEQQGITNPMHAALLKGVTVAVLDGVSSFAPGDEAKVDAMLARIDDAREELARSLAQG